MPLLEGVMPGSSPLARGLLHERIHRDADKGIIPARAGFTISSKRPPLTHRDHPRSRGVYRSEEWSASTPAGSSPLARGLRRADVLLAAGVRIIPARAGVTWAPRSGRRPGADHPRSRGVYGLDPSSPIVGFRIIPARAGFTTHHHYHHHHHQDHPRSRGVYATTTCTASWMPGSSPLARGLRRDPMRSIAATRIIPARAGFTSGGSASPVMRGDHPRSRGVYKVKGLSDGAMRGSSPLARGLPITGNTDARTRRIIPARAGFTHRRRRKGRQSPDHPRSRGVYSWLDRRRESRMGSSPLARGLHPGDRPDPIRPRIIPARAGFTLPGTAPGRRSRDHPRSRGVY